MNAAMSEVVNEELTCAARAGIDVASSTQVLDQGHLHLISPRVVFHSGFDAGNVTVVSQDPCPACSQ